MIGCFLAVFVTSFPHLRPLLERINFQIRSSPHSFKHKHDASTSPPPPLPALRASIAQLQLTVNPFSPSYTKCGIENALLGAEILCKSNGREWPKSSTRPKHPQSLALCSHHARWISSIYLHGPEPSWYVNLTILSSPSIPLPRRVKLHLQNISRAALSLSLSCCTALMTKLPSSAPRQNDKHQQHHHPRKRSSRSKPD